MEGGGGGGGDVCDGGDGVGHGSDEAKMMWVQDYVT